MIVLLLGVLAVCAAVLPGPFARVYGGLLMILERRVRGAPDPVLPPGLWWALQGVFPGLVLALLAAILVVRPVIGAVRRQRTAPSTVASAPAASSTRPRGGAGASAGDGPGPATTSQADGRLVGDDGRAGTPMHRTEAELRLLARSASIPWSPGYTTEGGARALLELVRAMESGRKKSIAPGVPAGEGGTGGSGEVPQESGPEGDGDPGASDPDPDPDVDLGLEAGLDADPDTASADADADSGADAALEEGGAVEPSTWTPSCSGSVYTSTDLYTPQRFDLTGGSSEEESGMPTDGVGGAEEGGR